MSRASDIFSWDDIFNEWKAALERESPIALKQSNYEDFNSSLNDILDKYCRNISVKILKKITPTLDHVRSFTSAVGALTQSQMIATLTWGALLNVIEASLSDLLPQSLLTLVQCVCRFSSQVEKTFDLIANVNNYLPLYDRSLALHPNAASLRWSLRRLFENYMTCCLEIVKHFSRKPLSQLESICFLTRVYTLLTLSSKPYP
jgi:hypothetical protein